MPKFEEGEKAGRAIISALKGEISHQQAATVVKQIMTRCVTGLHGVCQTHGQVIADCEKEGRC